MNKFLQFDIQEAKRPPAWLLGHDMDNHPKWIIENINATHARKEI